MRWEERKQSEWTQGRMGAFGEWAWRRMGAPAKWAVGENARRRMASAVATKWPNRLALGLV